MFGRVIFEITPSVEKQNELEVIIVGRKNTYREKIGWLNPILRKGKARMSTLKDKL